MRTSSFWYNSSSQNSKAARPCYSFSSLLIALVCLALPAVAKAAVIGKQNTADCAADLDSTTTGHDNTGIGYAALTDDGIGTFNTAVGAYSLQTNEGANYNTALGWGTLYNNLSGRGNTALRLRAR